MSVSYETHPLTRHAQFYNLTRWLDRRSYKRLYSNHLYQIILILISDDSNFTNINRYIKYILGYTNKGKIPSSCGVEVNSFSPTLPSPSSPFSTLFLNATVSIATASPLSSASRSPSEALSIESNINDIDQGDGSEDDFISPPPLLGFTYAKRLMLSEQVQTMLDPDPEIFATEIDPHRKEMWNTRKTAMYHETLVTFAIVIRNAPLLSWLLDPEPNLGIRWDERMEFCRTCFDQIPIPIERIVNDYQQLFGGVYGQTPHIVVLFKLFLTKSALHREAVGAFRLVSTISPYTLREHILAFNQTQANLTLPQYAIVHGQVNLIKCMIDAGIAITYEDCFQPLPTPFRLHSQLQLLNTSARTNDITMFKYAFDLYGGKAGFFSEWPSSVNTTAVRDLLVRRYSHSILQFLFDNGYPSEELLRDIPSTLRASVYGDKGYDLGNGNGWPVIPVGDFFVSHPSNAMVKMLLSFEPIANYLRELNQVPGNLFFRDAVYYGAFCLPALYEFDPSVGDSLDFDFDKYILGLTTKLWHEKPRPCPSFHFIFGLPEELTRIKINRPLQMTFHDNTTVYRIFLLRNFRSKIGTFYHQPGTGVSIELPLVFYLLSEGQNTLALLSIIFAARGRYPMSLNATIELHCPQSLYLTSNDLPIFDPLSPTPRLLSPLLFTTIISIDQAGCRPPLRKPQLGYVPAIQAIEMMIEHYMDSLIDGTEEMDHPQLHFDASFSWR